MSSIPFQLEAALLGAIQGLTEFLPVSSSAHLAIVPKLLGTPDPGLAFDVVLHLGTLVALLIYYRREWASIVWGVVRRESGGLRLFGLLVTATVPGAIIGFLFQKQAETVFRSPLLNAVALAVFGVILWWVDRQARRERTIDGMTYWQALVIGMSQALAVIPGVSRSGATITAARLVGLDRREAAAFSFLMAAPIIAGAGLVEAPHVSLQGGVAPLVLGFFMAAVFGLLAIGGLLSFVQRRSYAVFAAYRIAAAALVFALFCCR
ncbi:MAG: undecaprenyl-diphosphatase UppP [Deltaproteobacteria bacterium]|nr:undecaprenyl-diphosphatase UppP [Deltaproteobacteria bacterium]